MFLRMIMKNVSLLSIGCTAFLLISCVYMTGQNVECVSSLYEENRQQYDIWEKRFSALFPEYEVYDAGSYCLLDNGMHLVTFSYFDSAEGKQMIAIFDQDKLLLRFTQGLKCVSAGDLSFPKIIKLKDEIATVECVSGDAGFFLKEVFKIDLNTFDIKRVK